MFKTYFIILIKLFSNSKVFGSIYFLPKLFAFVLIIFFVLPVKIKAKQVAILVNTRTWGGNFIDDMDQLIWHAVNDTTIQWQEKDMF